MLIADRASRHAGAQAKRLLGPPLPKLAGVSGLGFRVLPKLAGVYFRFRVEGFVVMCTVFVVKLRSGALPSTRSAPRC